MGAPRRVSLAVFLIGCSAFAQEPRSEIMSRQSDFDPVAAAEMENLKVQIEQLQKQNDAEAQAKYQEDLLRLKQLQATQEERRQNELRKRQSKEEVERQKKREEQERSLWPSNQPGVVGLTAVPGENGEPAHYLSQPGASPENDKEAQEKAEFTKAVEQSKADVLRIYPDAGVDGTPLKKKITEITDHMEAQGNPLVHQADAPLKIAQMAANELGIPPQP